MNRRKIVVTLLVCLACISLAQAGLRFGFWLDKAAYDATDVVVASKVAWDSGELKVLEVWKGTLQPGQRIRVPEMTVFTNVDLRTEWGNSSELIPWMSGTNPPVVLSGKRLILFLKKKPIDQKASTPEPQTKSDLWSPAVDLTGVYGSAVWVQNEKVYSFGQPQNPGPLVLLSNIQTENQIKQRSLQIDFERTSLAQISKIADPATRARMAAPYVNSNGFRSASQAFSILSGCKEAGIPLLRELFQDPSQSRLHETAMAALVDAGDTLVAQDIRRYLLEELDFWKKYGPNLPQGWWNMLFMKEPTMDSCREHYRKILHGLSVLTHGRFRELDPLVEEILELWQSLPQLEEIGKGRSTDGRLVGKSQIVQVAKQALGQQP